ncbi:serine hydrolase domain-containing protein [Paenibacillus sp. MBLB4367]|uniref:serine hydrolase domain-containing protein n=1 Tax=Paenibacillus sp. MBLB4367 TaxID=3384767 RepID=UPI003908359A
MIADLLSQKPIHRWANRPSHQVTVGLLHKSARTIWTTEQSDGVDSSKFIYEIGSITKTMTGLLLAIGEQNGIWNRSDPLSAFVPEWSSSLFANRTTLLDLVTHTSGLPVVPGNFKAAIADRLNPYAEYDDVRLIEAVLSESPKKKSKHRYSNYGFGLLGWLLSRRLGTSLHEALAEHIFKPLGMTNAGIGVSRQPSGHLLPVYNAKGKPVPHWDFLDTLEGAGAVRSTMTDMLNYLEAYLHPFYHPLSPAISECLQEHYAIMPSRGIGVGYSWMMFKEKDGSTTHWHNGGTYGSSSFMSFNRERETGFVILSNNGSTIWSQLAPMIGIRMMSVDQLASILSKKLFAAGDK